jgi:cytoskeletal protein CcmA (bactofilin family)
MSSSAIGGFGADARGAASIGKAVKITGQIFSREDFYVDGEVEGTLEALEHRITVGPNATIRASIKAREVVVLGAINGNVEAVDRIEIRKEARLTGDLRTARITIEDGAFFKGSIDIVKPEPPKNQPQAAKVPVVSVAEPVRPVGPEAKR